MTLDQALNDIVEIRLSAKLAEITDPDAWTKESRDELYEKVLEVNSDSISAAIELIDDFSKKEVDGKPLLHWYIEQYSLQTVLQLLSEIRDKADAMTEDERKDFAFDTEWLTVRIQAVYTRLRVVSSKINIAQYLGVEKTEAL